MQYTVLIQCLRALLLSQTLMNDQALQCLRLLTIIGQKETRAFKYKLTNTIELAGNSNCPKLCGSQQS